MNLSEPIDLVLPRTAQLEPVGPAKVPALMSFEAFRALLDAHPGLRALELQGAGEPLAHPRFFDMVSYAAARGIEVSTRSTLLTISDARIEECIASGLARLEVDPGAADPSDCDYLRAGSKLRRALANVRRLAAKKKTQPEIRVVLTVLRGNVAQLAELIRLARAHGAHGVRLQHLGHDLTSSPRFVQGESLRHESVDFAQAAAAAEALGIALELPSERRCERPWRVIHVGASGEALPCAAARTPQRAILGNARREGLAQVWNNDAYREFRERLASGSPPELCKGCSQYRRPAQAALVSNSLASRSV